MIKGQLLILEMETETEKYSESEHRCCHYFNSKYHLCVLLCVGLAWICDINYTIAATIIAGPKVESDTGCQNNIGGLCPRLHYIRGLHFLHPCIYVILLVRRQRVSVELRGQRHSKLLNWILPKLSGESQPITVELKSHVSASLAVVIQLPAWNTIRLTCITYMQPR